MPDDLARRRRLLFTIFTALYRYPSGQEPALTIDPWR